jgi:hypothetical protein
VKRYNVEVVSAETGEEKTQNYLKGSQVLTLVTQMEVGDALVINRTEDSESSL